MSHPDAHRHAESQRENERGRRARQRDLMGRQRFGSDPAHHERAHDKGAHFEQVLQAHPVSYTHLTLPTSDLV